MESITAAQAAVGSPPVRLPAFRGGRPLKRWRYVAVFCEELMACAAVVRVGPARHCFWALHLRPQGELRQRTHMLRRRGSVELAQGRLAVRDGGAQLELRLDEDDGFAAHCRHGGGDVWTRKQAGISARGTLSIDGARPREIRALAVVDDTAGYHARDTEWWWSAGVGTAADGDELAWNLVCGVNDPPRGSERAVWVAGTPREAPAVAFARDLSRIICEDGSELSFHAEAERARRENLLLVKSEYRAPFGTFAGALPGGLALAHGLGVVEHHRARW